MAESRCSLGIRLSIFIKLVQIVRIYNFSRHIYQKNYYYNRNTHTNELVRLSVRKELSLMVQMSSVQVLLLFHYFGSQKILIHIFHFRLILNSRKCYKKSIEFSRVCEAEKGHLQNVFLLFKKSKPKYSSSFDDLSQ